jgi:hypothetical protein
LALAERRGSGYVIEVEPDVLDLHEFDQLVSAAASAADDDTRERLLTEALERWRGEAFAGLETPWLFAAGSKI